MLKHRILLMTLLLLSAPVFADNNDSSVIKPVIVTPNYSAQEVASSPVENERFDLLPTCPDDPKCPGKNDPPLSPADRDRLCPEQCTKTRKVTPEYGNRTDNMPQYTNVSDVVNAVCPSGYAQVAAYNPQLSITRDTSRIGVRPVPIGEIPTYKALGYTCSADGVIQPDKIGFCGDPKQSPIPLKVLQNINGYAAEYVKSQEWFCYTALSCGDDFFKTSCNTVGAVRRYWGIFQYWRCLPPANNLYYTKVVKPASIVCAQVRSVWKQQTQNP